MRLTLSLKKSLEQNAAVYFERAKKAKKRIQGVKATIARYEQEREHLLTSRADELHKQEQGRLEKRALQARPKAWYHAFRWFITSDGFLVVGGRDASTNDAIIKKHAEPGDLVLHTDMAGSPFVVIKSQGRTVTDTAKREAADATATFSRAWKLGMARQDVFFVQPGQVSKTAKSGEYLAKGAFVILGKAAYLDNRMNLAVGIDADGRVMAGPREAVNAHCASLVELEQGTTKPSDMAKQIKHCLSGGTIDEIIRALPAGGFKIKKPAGQHAKNYPLKRAACY